jgi:Pentapeptide repeats (8 copies)
MADESQLSILARGVEAWNSWRKQEGRGVSPVLFEADLSEEDFTEADFSKADFSEAYLSKANLSSANFSGANLTEANLSEANLCWANFSRAGLSKANLSKADLSKAILYKANLFGADLTKAYLFGNRLAPDPRRRLVHLLSGTPAGYRLPALLWSRSKAHRSGYNRSRVAWSPPTHNPGDRPQLEWTVWMHEPPVLRLLNMVSKQLPLWSWQHAPLLKPREWMARLLGMGTIKLAGHMPSGHYGILMPQRMYLIDRAHVQLEGLDLGTPVRVRPNPRIGGSPLPARGILAIGQVHWEIRDEAEYHRTRAELGVSNP